MNPWWLIAAPAAGALAISLLNVVGWPRNAKPLASGRPAVSVLIPCRNEERNIETCLRSVFPELIDGDEVIVCDDDSTDETPTILGRLASEFPALRVVSGRPLADGWVGKPNACDVLSRHARNDLLVFVDSDVCLHSGSLGTAAGLLKRYNADVLTAVPRQDMVTIAERVVMPWLDLTYVSWLPMPLVWLSSDPRFLAANGQFLAMNRTAYTACGGFDAVRGEVVDDMALCRNAKRAGLRVVFADGSDLATCRMYRGWDEIRDGFSKNLYEGIGGHPLALLAVMSLYGAAFVLPWLLLPFAPLLPLAIVQGAAAAVAMNLVQRVVVALQRGHGPLSILLHPAGALAFLGIAVNSYRWSRAGRIQWSGRVYAPTSTRSSRTQAGHSVGTVAPGATGGGA
jgi:chlorobactene glucosyltransferase